MELEINEIYFALSMLFILGFLLILRGISIKQHKGNNHKHA